MAVAGRQMLRVDIHCHVLTPAAEALASPHFTIDKEPTLAFANACTRQINADQHGRIHGQSTDLSIRLADMDRMGIDQQVISPAPTQYYYWLPPDLGCETSRLVNDNLAACAAHASGRFVAMGLAGIFSPTSGRVLYRGVPVNGLNLATGYMTQNDHLLPWRTIAHNVRTPLEINHVARAAADRRVAELLEIVGLSAFARSYPSQISGGMRKRAALARLLAYDPETLLLDEPFVALDAQLRLVMQSELRSLCRRLGKTALFVTHDVDEAAALGDRCIIFTARPGRIRKIVDIDLPRDRDVLRLRHDPRYSAISASLWEDTVGREKAGKRTLSRPTTITSVSLCCITILDSA